MSKGAGEGRTLHPSLTCDTYVSGRFLRASLGHYASGPSALIIWQPPSAPLGLHAANIGHPMLQAKLCPFSQFLTFFSEGPFRQLV